MSIEQNKRIVARFFDELWNERRLDAAREIVASDCLTHQMRSGSPDATAPRTPEILAAHVSDWLGAFPDIRFTIDEMVAEADRVAVRCTASGTHSGAWLGLAATGTRIDIRMSVTYRLAGGKIAEDWVLVDFLGVFQQLGIVAPTNQLLRPSPRPSSKGEGDT